MGCPDKPGNDEGMGLVSDDWPKMRPMSVALRTQNGVTPDVPEAGKN
jgi:hypothetical protein